MPSLNSIPRLEDYGVSERYGFLPRELPVQRLKDDYYESWEDVISKLPDLLVNRELRSEIDKLPELKVKQSLLDDIGQLRRSYCVLCFLANAYVWGGDKPAQVLPDNIANPLLITSDKLGLPPLSTYASLILWNFKLNDGEAAFDIISTQQSHEINPDVVTTINTFTGLIDESWFYIISMFYEKIGGVCLNAGLNLIRAARDDSKAVFIEQINIIAEKVKILGDLFSRMDEKTNPDIFYNVLRPFLSGWKGMENEGLPNGVKYGKNGKFYKYAGGSNAQSSLIQFLDVLLDVQHMPVGVKNQPQPTTTATTTKSITQKDNKKSFIYEMRSYMPREHRQFLDHVKNASTIRSYVLANEDDPEITRAYDACLDRLKEFRDKHMKLVARYIINPAKKQKGTFGLATKGTGSTDFLPFLKQCRDETLKAEVNRDRMNINK
ncbi:hypothetical protein Kpol_520p15 [Vanderwaltozyma polyspora DSM 70294]|uniref:Indoleamine 2,3-dioxygenase n=1 Tax=Vanderwaltozyma polyspora (strain ATCC 22028 / DSM 70294 / BCRC 21397 / CBS 2163 / NBRC 10782 / NRRL Y-8283 / UCD 57-17) TaxID=436907 RepID=A7TMA0_VANPO|nr:uncharacterized protein Kpol_520p15 [Vanderwaltozyma polyspora DSM 70294]EDO16594.1 hypothetical protein Kpol_520p15 [Vanderwaltozyma polyspora DSM 70294]